MRLMLPPKTYNENDLPPFSNGRCATCGVSLGKHRKSKKACNKFIV